MVGKRKKFKPREPVLAGSHQRCWIWGRHAVLTTLRTGTWRPLEVHVASRLEVPLRDEIGQLAGALGVEVQAAEFDDLTSRCRSAEHQGLLAKMPAYPYAALDALLAAAAQRDEPAFLLVLDAVQDPYNFGAILRSADVFGALGVLVGEHAQCEVTAHVARAAAGAASRLTIARTRDLVAAMATLREHGVRVFAAAGEARDEAAQIDLRPSTAIVIGNEGAGVREELRMACDGLLRIPQRGGTESLNAAVAAGILCYEVDRQRRAPSPRGEGQE